MHNLWGVIVALIYPKDRILNTEMAKTVTLGSANPFDSNEFGGQNGLNLT